MENTNQNNWRKHRPADVENTSAKTTQENDKGNESINQNDQREEEARTPKTEESKICQNLALLEDVASPPPIHDKHQEESKMKPLTNATKAGKKVEMIGDYQVDKLLGIGGYGQVKLGIHHTSGKKVAIKIVRKRLQRTEQARKRISREIEILQKIKHPNLIECYEIIETATTWFMITEYCEGGELFHYLEDKGRISEIETAKLFAQLLDGIEYLHQNGIAHRDIKLENILLDENNRVKIADFGMSSMYNEGQTLQTRCGSPHYLSPEMLAGKSYNPLTSDIWSCGVILYTLVAGYMPFDDWSDADIFKKINKGNYDDPGIISSDCADLISRIFDTNSKTRITIPEIREHALMNVGNKKEASYIEEL